MATILQVHERHITVNGAVSQQMAQYVNRLIEENEKKTLWIANQMKESQAQREVLRQHEMGQQVLAEMIKWVASRQQQAHQQQPYQQITACHGPTVTVVDDEDGAHMDFLRGPNPHSDHRTLGPHRWRSNLSKLRARHDWRRGVERMKCVSKKIGREHEESRNCIYE